MPRAALSPVEVEAFRDSLCAVATERFAERGYEGVTLRGLARELGCSPMTPYRYFENKAEIFEAVRTAAFERFAAALQQALDASPSPAQSHAKQKHDARKEYPHSCLHTFHRSHPHSILHMRPHLTTPSPALALEGHGVHTAARSVA